jgi:membrane protein required for colicin V production
MPTVTPVDLLVLGILALALVRGVLRGMVREAASLAAHAGTNIVVQLLVTPVGEWLVEITGGEITRRVAPWIAGALLAIATITAVTFVGGLLLRGVKAAGLRWVDRLGGAVVGTAEGALVAILLLLVVTSLLGRDHSLFAQSRSLDYLEQFEQATSDMNLPASVSSPPPH